MHGYGATIGDRGDYEVFVYDSKELDEPPRCIVDGDIATFRFYTQKPDLPYAIGSCLKAQPDNDNFPGLESGYLEKDLRHEIETVDPLRRCLLHPPPRGTVEPGEVEFKVVDWVQAGDPNNSQVVAVRILNSTLDLPTDVDVLAKIYDPLYFNHLHYGIDMFRFNDFCYRRESAAYRHLADLQGSIIPKYYGSFTISVPVDGEDPRDVRLILLEIVPGQSMDKLDPSSFTQAERQEIMKAVVDSDRAVYARKVINRDVDPRNIVLPPKKRHRDRRAVVVDLGVSRVKPDLDDKTYLTGLAHPPKRFHCLDDYNFWEWVDWDWEVWINEQYAHIKGSSITDREEFVLHDYQEYKVPSTNDGGIGQRYMSRAENHTKVENGKKIRKELWKAGWDIAWTGIPFRRQRAEEPFS